MPDEDLLLVALAGEHEGAGEPGRAGRDDLAGAGVSERQPDLGVLPFHHSNKRA
jgi:hypothetical protein